MTDPVLWLVPILVFLVVVGLALWVKLAPDDDPDKWPGID